MAWRGICAGGDPGACQSPSPPTLPRGRRLKAGDRVIPYGGVEAFTWGCTSQITTTEGEKTGGMTKMLNWNPETGDDDTGRCQHDRLQSAPDSSGERPPSLGVW